MTTPARSRPSIRSPLEHRRTLRHLTAALSGGVGLLYVALFFLVADAEAGAAENTYGAYLLLSVLYVVGAALLVIADRRALWISGAAVQVAVVILFAMFGAGLFGPGQGVFDYDALSGLHVELWAAAITGAQLLLLGLMAYLAYTQPSGVRTSGDS
jgi:hypothetical protein